LPTAAGLADSVPAFAAGTALWALALLLISIPRQFAPAVRLLGLVSAILFAIVAARIFGGRAVAADRVAAAVPCLPLVAMTFMGWIWTLLRENE
jgi:hypothetical protein